MDKLPQDLDDREAKILRIISQVVFENDAIRYKNDPGDNIKTCLQDFKRIKEDNEQAEESKDMAQEQKSVSDE
jgi:hypothetical protein